MVKRIYEKVKSIIFADPKALYQKEISLTDQPFYFPGTNGRAVLLIHGWTTTPYELHRLGVYLNEKGYSVLAPLLTGHGTNPKDLENVKWEDWSGDAQKAYLELKKKHEKIYVIGTSLGANLTSILAGNNLEISGLVLMAMPYAVRMERLTWFFARIILPFKKYNKKYYPPTFGSSAMVTRKISYQTYPIKSVLELFKLVKFSRRVLGDVKQPCLILQSSADHIVAKKSLEHIFEQIGSKIKKKKYLHNAYHTFISDIKNEHIFEDILQFLDEN